MSLWQRRDDSTSTQQIIPPRVTLGKAVTSVTTEDALRQSVAWAALNLRASLTSLMPVDVYRKVPGGGRVEVSPPPVLVSPSEFADGHPISIADWLYASEMSLGLHGNHWGIIRSADAAGRPTQIETVQPSDVVMRIKGTRIIEYRYGGEKVPAEKVWHERRFLLPGVPVGLSPIVYSALSIAMSRGAGQYAADWFAGAAIPAAHLRNIEKTIKSTDSAEIKARFKDSVASGDVFVSGKDWEYQPLQAKAAESGFVEAMGFAALDLVRFCGVPGDMVDVHESGSSITYANITQRNVQLMTINMGPALKARDDALTTLTARPQYVRLNRSAMLAMDDLTRATVIKTRIDSRTLTPDEARAFEDQQPLTDAQYEQFDRLFEARRQLPPPA